MQHAFQGHDGVRLIGDVLGPQNGPPVILLHGGGQTRQSWGGTQKQLARRGFLAMTYDSRGHGESDWAPDGDYALDAFALDLRAVAAWVGRPVFCIGASLGGHTISMALAQTPALDVRAVVFVDIVPRVNPAGRARVLAFMSAHPDGFATPAEAADAVAEYLPHRNRRPRPEGLRKNLRLRENGRHYWHWDPAFIDRRQDAALVGRLEHALAVVDVPLLVVRGMLSDVVTDKELQDFRRAVPRTEIAMIGGAAHMVAGDKNDVFSQAVISFLERCCGPP